MEDQIWIYFIKRFNGTETEESRAALDKWLKADEGNVQKLKEARDLWELTAMIPPERVPLDPRILILRTEAPIDSSPLKGQSFRKYALVASISVTFLLVVLYYFTGYQNRQAEEWVVKKAQVGEMIALLLPDSSKVWLNAGSEISYLSNFNDAKLREVKLKGEAYFEVHHDKSHPFVVNSGALQTTVYGTSFSIRAYPNEKESTVAVNSGKVGVQTADKKAAALMLLPNDKVSYSAGHFAKSNISKADVDAWIKGELIFDQTPMPVVFATLARKFKVNVNLTSQDYASCKLTARFQNQPLSDILKALKISMNMSSKQIADTIYIKGGNCM